jgi:hypothetical protein
MAVKAKFIVAESAAKKADKVFADLQRALVKTAGAPKGRKLDLVDPLHYPFRKAWLDAYQQAGGAVNLLHVCARARLVRILPLEVEDSFRAKVEDKFQAKHPELKGKPLSQNAPKNAGAREKWAALRNEWLDIFESLGGDTVVIAGLEQGTPVRIPKV